MKNLLTFKKHKLSLILLGSLTLNLAIAEPAADRDKKEQATRQTHINHSKHLKQDLQYL